MLFVSYDKIFNKHFAMKTREQIIEDLKSAGFWNEDTVKCIRPEFVDAILDFFRFAEEKFRLDKEQKEKGLYESIKRLMDSKSHCENIQHIDVDLGLFTKKE